MTSVSRWFIDNPIAAKIIMLIILLGGMFGFSIVPKVFFPIADPQIVRISVIYPGAGPEEVEKQVTERIEESVRQLGGIEEVRSVSREGFAEVTIEASPTMNLQSLLNDVRANVDAISTFPASLERLQVVEQRQRTTVMRLQLVGGLNERELKEKAEDLRDRLAAYPEIDIVQLSETRNYELSIDITADRLREYALSFDDVANAVRAYSFDQPIGKLRDARGDVQLQARLQADTAIDFARIPILRQSSGSVIYLEDVAEISDGFEDTDYHSQLNRRDSVGINIITQSNPDLLKTTDRVKQFVAMESAALNEAGYELHVVNDLSISYRGRLDTLFKNGLGGLVLVFLLLMFFLRPALAFWVCGGIAVSFFGALAALTLTPVTFNIMSMFAFILILGIVVDDAIIIGESIYTQQQISGSRRLGAVRGVQVMTMPVSFAVISTMIFFVPFFDLSDSPDTTSISVPVILALTFSLIECLFLLPSHLAKEPAARRPLNLSRSGKPVKILQSARQALEGLAARFSRIQQPVADLLPRFAETRYRRWLCLSIMRKRVTVVVFGFFLLLSVALVRGGWLPLFFLPQVEADFVIATARLPESTAYSHTEDVMENIRDKGEQLRDEINAKYNQRVVTDIYASIYENSVFVLLGLDDTRDRPLSAKEISTAWRLAIGKLYGVTDLQVDFSFVQNLKPVAYEVAGNSLEDLRAFSQELLDYIESLDGAYAAQSTLENPASEINIALKSSAEPLGITMREISEQVRDAFYGEEVQRIPRQREDVKVFVRYPRDNRSYEEALWDMDIRTQAGDYIPLTSLVDFSYRDAYKKIERVDGQRVAEISASVHAAYSSSVVSNQVRDYMQNELLPRFPGIAFSQTGEQEERQTFFSKLFVYFSLAMLAIFGLMAVIFRSYWQPLLVLSAVPFGFAGGVFGHMLLGSALSMMSILGMLACAGVVVNDNVVLLDRINQLRVQGFSPRRAVVEAAVQRFRPIVLTSLTTFLGLSPILLESSVQAQFLIPMVISLSFGVLFASSVTLILVPCAYLVMDKILRFAGIDQTLDDVAVKRA